MKRLIIIFIVISVNHVISQEILTNKTVYDLIELGFESEIIIAKINSSECDFDTTIDGLKQLKSKEVPSRVILAMIEKSDYKKRKLNSLIGGVSNSEGSTSVSEGNDNVSGDKGRLDGNPYAPSYFGDPGTGSGGIGYGLNGRGRATYQTIRQDCNESGLVVVRIEVDRNGSVTKAEPGVRGTTNSAPCLLEPAKKIALSHKWRPDSKAPSKQIGFVKVNFTLGN
jgi:colicin import membrane protein